MLPSSYLNEFSEDPGFVNFASTGPVARRVVAAVTTMMEEVAAARRPLHELSMGAMAGAKEAIAGFLGVAPDAATVVPSTSAGLFQAAFGLRGDNVVVPAHEFPANVYPWLRAAERDGPAVRLIEVPDYRVTPERIGAAVDRGTVAVALSFVDFRTGFRADLAGIRDAIGDALLIVDAIQGLGAVRFPRGVADVVVAGGQKWLRAGWGCGLMVVSERARQRLGTALTGWFGVDDFMDFGSPPPHPPRAAAERYLEGSPGYYGAAALRAALGVIAEAGMEVIEDAVLERTAAIEQVLREDGAEVTAPWTGPHERAGIVSFRMPREAAADVKLRLDRAGIIASERSGWIRVSPHATTPIDVADRIAAALRA